MVERLRSARSIVTPWNCGAHRIGVYARAATILYYMRWRTRVRSGQSASVCASASLKFAPSQLADRSEVGAVCASPWNLAPCIQGACERTHIYCLRMHALHDTCLSLPLYWYNDAVHLLRCAPRSLRPSTRRPRARPPAGSPCASQTSQAWHPRNWNFGSRLRRAGRRRGRRLGRCISRSVTAQRREQHHPSSIISYYVLRGYMCRHNAPMPACMLLGALALVRSKPRRSIPV